MIEQLLEVVRLESERAESLQGFQLVHSLGGGTGSGMGTLLLSRLREEFPDKMLWTWSVTETSCGDCAVRPYNYVLSLHYLIEHADTVVYIDDDVTYKVCSKQRVSAPSYRHLNNVSANIMSNVTCSMRLACSEAMTLRKITTNLVPFTRTHFLTVGTAPLVSNLIEGSSHSVTHVTLADIVSQLFERDNMLLAYNEQNTAWKNMAALYSFRGTLQPADVDKLLKLVRNKYSSKCTPWIPDNFKATLCNVAAPGVNMSSTFLANNTAVFDVLQRTDTMFTTLFTRKAFLHHYVTDGLDEMELKEAQSNLQDLINEYQTYQDAPVDESLCDGCSDNEVE